MTRFGAALVVCVALAACGSPVVPGADASPASLRPDRWMALRPAPVALTEVAAAAVAGRIWVAGGLRADGRASTLVQVFDPAANRWSEGPALPIATHHAALVSDGAILFLVGGYTGDTFSAPTHAVWQLTPGASLWTSGVPLPEPRAAGAAAWDGARIVFGGGVGPNGVSDTIYGLAEGRWQAIGSLSTPREHLAATSDGRGRTWFLGGRAGGLESNAGAVDLIEGREVRPGPPMTVPRGGVGAFWSERHGACLVGGEGPAGTFGDVECIAPDGTLRGLPALEVRRHGIAVATVGDAAYVLLGGWRPGLTVTDTVEALRL